MAETEQVKPLAPAANRIRSDEDEALSTQLKLRRRNYIICCGCVTAILLIIAVTLLVLTFTVFQIKNPVVTMNNITVEFADLVFRGDKNVTVVADVSIKNPNVASFKFDNGTTTIYYAGEMVGKGKIPPGKAKARRTIHLNVTVELIPDKLWAVPKFKIDLGSWAITMNSTTVIGGKVKILKIIKKHVGVRLNCTTTYNISRLAIQEQHCKPHLSF